MGRPSMHFAPLLVKKPAFAPAGAGVHARIFTHFAPFGRLFDIAAKQC